MRILVTGGAGYVGSHATRLFLERGHDVWVYDSLVYGHARAVPCTAVGAARTTNSNGTSPTHASHHHDKAGKARPSGAPAINAAA